MAFLAKSVVFNGQAAGGAPKRAASKLWTPGVGVSAAVESPVIIIVAPDAEHKMRGLSAKRREVILDMNDFAENEVRALVPRPSRLRVFRLLSRAPAAPKRFRTALRMPGLLSEARQRQVHLSKF